VVHREAALPEDGGEIVAFARDLRRLRERAGGPSYRELARRTNYSPSALSQAANGRSLPTLPVALAFVRGCGGAPQEWEERWRHIIQGCPGETAPAREGDSAEPNSAPRDVALAADGPVPDLRWWRRSRQPGPVLAAGLGAGMAVGVVLGVVGTMLVDGGVPGPSDAISASSDRGIGTPGPLGPGRGGSEPAGDGADPNRSGCGQDAATAAYITVHFPSSQLAGKLELRYSKSCGTAWPRFTPDAAWRPGPGITVTVWTVRPADHLSFNFSAAFGGEASIGDMLRLAPGCVMAGVSVASVTQQSPMAETLCWTGPSSSATPTSTRAVSPLPRTASPGH